jgi:hypothetical protein
MDETLFVRIVVVLILGNAARLLEEGFERLSLERCALMVSETKQEIGRPEDNAPRQQPPPEREAPRLRQVGELGGLHLSGKYVFAHSLIDKVALMWKDDVMCCLGVDECEKREQETQDDRKGRELDIMSHPLAEHLG